MRSRGVIIKFDRERGFGFIRSPDEERDIFVHVSDAPGRTELAVGEAVEFELEQAAKGPKAVKVSALNVGPGAAYIFTLLGGAFALVMTFLLRTAGVPLIAAYLIAVNAAACALVAYDRAVAPRGFVAVPRGVFRLFAFAGGVASYAFRRL